MTDTKETTVQATTPAKSTPAPVIKPVKPPPFVIQTSEDRAAERYIKLLVYGTHGSGKTRLAATAALVPAMNDVLIISAEGGELTIDSEANPEIRKAFSRIDSIRIGSYSDVANTFDFLKLHCELRDDFSEEGTKKLIELEAKFKQVDPASITTPRRYRTGVIDSLTEVENYCLNKILGTDEEASMIEETETAEWKHYKVQHMQMMRLVRYYRDLPMHMLMTCAQQYIQDEQKRQIFMPAMTGKLSSKVQGIFDIVGYLVVGTDTSGKEAELPRRLYVQPSSKWQAKCRISSYKKPYFDNPTMASILKETGMQK